MKFSDWLEEQFLLFELEQGRRQALAAFAAHLDIPNPILLGWLNGKKMPSVENLLKVCRQLGQDPRELSFDEERSAL